MSNIKNIPGTDLNSHIKDNHLVLVDFWADWCAPCKMVAPILEEVAGEYDKVHVIKVNVDESRDIAVEHGVRSIPTMIVFKDGEVVANKVGAATKSEVAELLKSHL